MLHSITSLLAHNKLEHITRDNITEMLHKTNLCGHRKRKFMSLFAGLVKPEGRQEQEINNMFIRYKKS